jgi:uncharacterized protein (TIGR00251 family)
LSWYLIKPDGVTLQIHAQPGAKRTEIVGLHGDCLKVRLGSPPVDGSANACLIEFLARRLRVKRSQVTITRGLSSHRKSVLVSVPGLQPAALLEFGGVQA